MMTRDVMLLHMLIFFDKVDSYFQSNFSPFESAAH
jgi:hypothetical protein